MSKIESSKKSKTRCFRKIYLFTMVILWVNVTLHAQTNSNLNAIDSLKVYWVGHSLMSGKDHNNPESKNVMELLHPLASAQEQYYDWYKHTTPGAPVGWNWGVPGSWSDIESKIAPLTDETHQDYGTFNAIVVTEGVNIRSSYDWWATSFYVRKFYNAALKANSKTRLFFYESWHHYNASDNDFRNYYGPQSEFNWVDNMNDAHQVWVDILNETADPNKTAVANDYIYQGNGEDPGLGDDSLDVFLIPTGRVLVSVLERLAQKIPGDNWYFKDGAKGDTLSPEDFWANPLLNFPSDLNTTVHDGDLDDIHPSDVLSYLNALTHYAVLYRSNPIDLPTTNFVPEPIANIFKEVVWEVVTNEPLTGLSGGITSNASQLKGPNFLSDKKGSFFGVNALGKSLKGEIVDKIIPVVAY